MMLKKLFSKPKYLLIDGILILLSIVLIPITLPGGNLYLEEIKNLGNVVISSDAENVVKELSFIPDDNNIAMEPVSITAVARHANGEIYAIRQGLG